MPLVQTRGKAPWVRCTCSLYPPRIGCAEVNVSRTDGAPSKFRFTELAGLEGSLCLARAVRRWVRGGLRRRGLLRTETHGRYVAFAPIDDALGELAKPFVATI